MRSHSVRDGYWCVVPNSDLRCSAKAPKAEIIRRRAVAGKASMGLTNWTGSRVLKRDIGTAKNYLDAREIDTLNRIVVMFLDRAEFRAQRRRDLKMADWEADLDKFLADTELPVLSGTGRVAHKDAQDWAKLNTTRSRFAVASTPSRTLRRATSMTSRRARSCSRANPRLQMSGSDARRRRRKDPHDL